MYYATYVNTYSLCNINIPNMTKFSYSHDWFFFSWGRGYDACLSLRKNFLFLNLNMIINIVLFFSRTILKLFQNTNQMFWNEFENEVLFNCSILARRTSGTFLVRKSRMGDQQVWIEHILLIKSNGLDTSFK